MIQTAEQEFDESLETLIRFAGSIGLDREREVLRALQEARSQGDRWVRELAAGCIAVVPEKMRANLVSSRGRS